MKGQPNTMSKEFPKANSSHPERIADNPGATVKKSVKFVGQKEPKSKPFLQYLKWNHQLHEAAFEKKIDEIRHLDV